MSAYGPQPQQQQDQDGDWTAVVSGEVPNLASEGVRLVVDTGNGGALTTIAYGKLLPKGVVFVSNYPEVTWTDPTEGLFSHVIMWTIRVQKGTSIPVTLPEPVWHLANVPSGKNPGRGTVLSEGLIGATEPTSQRDIDDLGVDFLTSVHVSVWFTYDPVKLDASAMLDQMVANSDFVFWVDTFQSEVEKAAEESIAQPQYSYAPPAPAPMSFPVQQTQISQPLPAPLSTQSQQQFFGQTIIPAPEPGSYVRPKTVRRKRSEPPRYPRGRVDPESFINPQIPSRPPPPPSIFVPVDERARIAARRQQQAAFSRSRSMGGTPPPPK